LRVKSAVAMGLVVSLVAITVLTIAFEPLDDLLVENPYWNGLSTMYSRYRPIRVKELSRLNHLVLDPMDSTLFLIGPSRPFMEDEIEAVVDFLRVGGRVVLADDFGSGNMLLDGLGVEAYFSGDLMLDPLFKDGNKVMPVVNEELVGFNVTELVLNYPTILRGVNSDYLQASSSPFSYISERPDDPVGTDIEDDLIPIARSDLDPVMMTLHEGDNLTARAACWFGGESEEDTGIVLSIPLRQGSYELSLYISDYDSDSRRERITVYLDGLNISRDIERDFQSGIYERFYVHFIEDEELTINFEVKSGSNAVVSGIFLDESAVTPTEEDSKEASFLGEDTETQGEWTEKYGDKGYILCGWKVPETSVPYRYRKEYDLSKGLEYTVQGYQWAWTPMYQVTELEDSGEESTVGPFTVLSRIPYGDGDLFLISDSSPFINSMINRGSNNELLEDLVVGQVFIDEAHGVPSRLSRAKNLFSQIYGVLQYTEVKYGLTIGLVYIMFNLQWKEPEEDKEVDEVEEVLREYPEYDREILEWLAEERRGQSK
jgi:hypothetical protein